MLLVLLAGLLAPQAELLSSKPTTGTAATGNRQFNAFQQEDDPGRLCYLPVADEKEAKSGRMVPLPFAAEFVAPRAERLAALILIWAKPPANYVFNPARTFAERCTCGPPGRV